MPRLSRASLAAVLGLAVPILALAPPGTARVAADPAVSSNWAGYVATGPGSSESTASTTMSFTDVTGQWVQPKAVCKGGVASSLAIWVGLGGYSLSSQELEQIGTEADCDDDGDASYYVWYELVPADPVNLKLRISPGDSITAVVKVDGHDILVQMTDRTRGTRFTRHLSMAKLDQTSADWVIEAPTICGDSGYCKQPALTRFGSIEFTKSYATGNGVGGTISSPTWMSNAIQLVPQSRRFFGDRNDSSAVAGRAGAIPSALQPDGSGFTIRWQASP